MNDPKSVHSICFTGSNGKGWTFLTEAVEVDYFGTHCSKGRAISVKPDSWVEGSTIYIPTNRIEYVLTYESEAAFFEARRRYKPPSQTPQSPHKKSWFGKK